MLLGIVSAVYQCTQPSIEQVNIHTNSLVKDVTAMRITIKALNERNRRMETALEERDRRMEATLLHISKTLGKQFDSS